MPLHPRPRPPNDSDDIDIAADDDRYDTAVGFTARRITTDGDWQSPLLRRIATRTERLPSPTVPADLTGPAGIVGRRTDDGSLTVAELRVYLTDRATGGEVKDLVWRCVIDRFRTDYTTRYQRQGWDMFAFGLAYPGLLKQARILAPDPSPPGWVQRVHADLAVNFLDKMATIDTSTDRVFGRLLRQTREATSHKGRGTAHQDDRDRRILDLDDYLTEAARGNPCTTDRLTYRPPEGHPLWALVRLVNVTRDRPAGKRLTIEDARLIAYTHIGGLTVAEAATLLGLSEPTARGRHNRAGHLIRDLLTPAKPQERTEGAATETGPATASP